METNWLILLVVGIAVLLLMFFLIRQNRKDEKIFEKESNLDQQDQESELNDDEMRY